MAFSSHPRMGLFLVPLIELYAELTFLFHKLYVIISMSRALNEDESPKIQTEFVPWRRFLEEWIYPDSPSADFVGYLDWCDIFIGGMDLTVDYL